tara:strand:- start:7317 stop:9389 length:2073 start_codon:yes stop_codon:yes gene_type:complete
MVKSELDKSIIYQETKVIDPEDKGYSSSIYSIEINDEEIEVAVGKEKYTNMEKNIVSFPIYIIINNAIKERIGIFEIDSNNMINIMDDDGDIDLNKGNILLFSYVTKDYLKLLNKEKIEILDANEIIEGQVEKDIIENEEELSEDEDEDDITKISNLKSKQIPKEKDDLLEDGIFKENLNMKKKPTLKEERESDSKDIKFNYEEKLNSEWINKFLKNNNYDIIDNGGGGDCFFATIRDAYEYEGKITTVSKLRALLSEKATDDKYMHYKSLYDSTNGELKTITKELEDLRKTGRILKAQHSKTENKEMGEKILENARTNLTEYKNKELEKIETEGLLEEFDFMADVKSFEDFKKILKTSDFWADMWAISVMEEALNIKIIILSEEAYYTGDLDSVMLCGHINSEDINKAPEYYIIVSHTGNHYKLITYKEKGLLKFKEIPYDIKMLIINKCMERNSGPYYLLKDFRELKMNMGLSSDEGSLTKTDEIINYDLFDPNTVFMFYNNSGSKKAGEGSGEKIPEDRKLDFNVLNNDKILKKDWRRKLDDSWKSTFKLNDMKWATVDHYYYGSQFKKGHPDFFKQFSLDSNSELCVDPKKAKAAASTKGKYEKKLLRPTNVKHDPDFFELGPNGRSREERLAALRAKFVQNQDMQKVLLSTKNAKLTKFVRSSPPIVDIELMEVRKEIMEHNEKK